MRMFKELMGMWAKPLTKEKAGNTRRIVYAFSFLLLMQFSQRANAQNDLPGPTANYMLIKNGSLVVGMDNTTQAVPGYFNLKSYGLINKLLQNNIPVKWAIKSGKPKDGVDFTATAQREYPSVLSATTYNFKAGPFIIDSAYAPAARTIMNAWGNSVAVYRLTQDVSVDIRYTLNFKPRIAVFNNGNNAKIHLEYLDQAGIDTSMYVTIIPELTPISSCQNGGGFSFASEAHWDDKTDTAVSRSVYRFVKNGGNFLAACVAIRLYENDDTLHTTTGIDVENANYNTFNYTNTDLPFVQIDGPLDDIGGALHNWNKKSTGSYRSNQYAVVGAPTGIPYQTAAAAKCLPNNKSGGNIFYLGGHSYGNKNQNDAINGRRMYLNAVFVPPGAAAYCNLQPLAVNLTPSNIRCHGEQNGSIATSISGGVAPYKCNWSTGDTTRNLSNLSQGVYTITITDNIGQTITSSVSIINPPQLVTSKTVSSFNGYNVSCSNSTNGFINLSVSGGTAPFSYQWTPTGSTSQNLSNIGPGTYCYIVTDSKGCVSSSSVSLNSPAPVNALKTVSNYNGSNVSCSGSSDGFINLTVSGGTGTYTYQWTPGGLLTSSRSNLPAGTYSYTVTDANGCSVSGSSTLTAPNQLNTATTASSYNGNGISCAGMNNGYINLAVTGGTAPYTYLWNPGGQTTANRTNLSAGTYSCTITDANGCTNTKSVTLTAPPALNTTKAVSNYSGSGVSCAGATNGFINLNVTGGTAPFSYSWTPGSSTSQNLTNLGAGTYSCLITDANGCTVSNSATLTAPNPLATPATTSNYQGNGVSCYGSTNGFINLSVSGGTGPYSYLWSPGGSTLQNRSNLGAGTYTYTVTDANGCSKTASVTLTAPAAINDVMTTSNYNGSGVSCQGATNGFINLAVSGGTGPYTYYWNPDGITTPNRINIGQGTYSYTVTDLNGCSRSGSVTLNAPPVLTAPYTVSDYNGSNVSCNGLSNGSISLNVNGGTGPYNYSWLPGGQTTQNLSNLTTGSYYYTVTDANGCTVSDNVVLTSSSDLNIPYTTSNYNGSGISCQGATNGFIHLAANGGTRPYVYAWNNTSSTDSSLVNIGEGTYVYTVTDANGCSFSGSITLNAPAPLDAPVSSSSFNGNGISCFGATDGYINLSVNGGTGPYSYSWMPGGNTTPGLTNLGAGTYSYTVTDANGCIVSGSVNLSSPLPFSVPNAVSNYNGSGISCYGSTDGSINLTVNGGTAPFSFNWMPGGITTQNLQSIGAGTYNYTVTDANGCIYNDAVTLVAPSPLLAPYVVSDYHGSSVSCNGSTDGYINLNVTGGTGPYSYTWSQGGGNTSTLTGIGAGNYLYNVTDANGCSYSDSITLTSPNPLNNTLQVSVFQGYNISCYGGSNGNINLTVAGGTGPYSFNWMPGNLATEDISGVAAGNYQVTVTDVNGCTAVSTQQLTEPANLALNANVLDVLCHGGSDGAVQTFIQGGVPGFTYAWSNGGNAAIVSGLSAGNYSVTVTDANGCTISNSYTIVQPQPINLTVTAPKLNGIHQISCFGMSDGSALANVNGGTSPYDFLWSNGSTSMGITGLSAGTYNLEITDGNNCRVSQSIVLTQPAPLIANAGTYQEICGNSAVLSAYAVSGGFTGTWNVQNGAGVFHDVQDPSTTIYGLNYGNNRMQWKVTDGICTAVDTVSIIAFEPVTAVAGSDNSICAKDLEGFTLRALQPVTGTGNWYSQGTAVVFDPFDANTRILSLADGDNIFTWTVSNGPCSSTDVVNVFLKSKDDCYEVLEMPSAFSPNGDGDNDDFDIHGIEKYPENSFQVFNRWGNLVYSSDNYVNHQWTGLNNKREPLPDGTYFVILVIKNSEIRLNGYVDLRR